MNSTFLKTLRGAGEVQFENGYPTRESLPRLHDEQDFERAVQLYQWALPLVSYASMQNTLRKLGQSDNNNPIWEEYLTADTVVFTGNNTTIYGAGFLNVKDTPIVVDLGPLMLGAFNDIWQKNIGDGGLTGPDKGKGGKYLVLPPDYKGEVPEGYFPIRSDTVTVFWLFRGLSEFQGKKLDPVAILKAMRIYRLDEEDNPPATSWINMAGMKIDLTPDLGYGFWEVLANSLQTLNVRPEDRVFVGWLATLGIEKGKPFAPDERMKKILTQSAEMGRTMAMTATFDSRYPEAILYPGTQWRRVFPGPNVNFEYPDYIDIDGRLSYTYSAIFTQAAMDSHTPDFGQSYALSSRDSQGDLLVGQSTYRLHLAANVPASTFWSVTVYNLADRSMIANDQKKPALDSGQKLRVNPDGSTDLYFGPKVPEGFESNWVQTDPGKAWWVWFRWYGPTEPFFDQSWKLTDFEKIN